MIKLVIKSIVSILIGISLFLTWNSFIDMVWSREGSFDILSGAILEFFLFQVLLNFNSNRQTKQLMKHLEQHLDKVEQMLFEAKIK